MLRPAEDSEPAQSSEATAPDLARTLGARRPVLADWRRGVALEAVERRVAGMSTRPFDTAILRRLGTAVVAILVALVTTTMAGLFKPWTT